MSWPMWRCPLRGAPNPEPSPSIVYGPATGNAWAPWGTTGRTGAAGRRRAGRRRFRAGRRARFFVAGTGEPNVAPPSSVSPPPVGTATPPPVSARAGADRASAARIAAQARRIGRAGTVSPASACVGAPLLLGAKGLLRLLQPFEGEAEDSFREVLVHRQEV